MSKLREIKVSSIQDGLKRMQAFLFANMLDNELEVDDPHAENPNYFIKLIWLFRDVDGGNKVGCPCFASDFRGILPSGEKVHGIVYVKVFADKDYRMVSMHIVRDEANFDVDEICDGDEIRMHDDEGRYADELFVYKDGIIEKIG